MLVIVALHNMKGHSQETTIHGQKSVRFGLLSGLTKNVHKLVETNRLEENHATKN